MNDKREQIEGFTPGPWETHEGEDYIVVLRPNDTTDTGILVDKIEDASLIALAPNLYAENESLRAEVARLREALLPFADLSLNDHPQFENRIRLARAALKVTPP